MGRIRVYRRRPVPTSTATISRVNRSLQFGAEGYELVLDALIAKDLKGKK